jgi:hypothetical protein
VEINNHITIHGLTADDLNNPSVKHGLELIKRGSEEQQQMINARSGRKTAKEIDAVPCVMNAEYQMRDSDKIRCTCLSLESQSLARRVMLYRDDGLKRSARYVEDHILRNVKQLMRLLNEGEHHAP